MAVLPIAEFLELEAVTLILVVTRVSGLFLFGPMFSAQIVPGQVRFFLALATSVVLVGMVPPPAAAHGSLVELAVLMVGELLVGLVLGTLLQMVFQALQLAGQVAGTQIGFALANVVNPQFDEQISTISIIYVTVAALVFLTIGGDREMLAALLETFEILPLGTIFFHESVGWLALAAFQQSMILAVRVAAPVTVALVFTEIALGFVGRTVPQLNILSVGFSLRIMIGLAITMVSIHSVGAEFVEQMVAAFATAYDALAELVPLVGAAPF